MSNPCPVQSTQSKYRNAEVNLKKKEEISTDCAVRVQDHGNKTKLQMRGRRDHGQSKVQRYETHRTRKIKMQRKKTEQRMKDKKKSNPRISLHIRMRIHRPNQFDLGLQLFPASLIFRLGHPLLRPVQREKNLACAALDDTHCLP